MSDRMDNDQGFTLVEVMIVVLIIGILLAIGVPTFLGARTRAQDRAAQTSLRTAHETAAVIATDTGDFTGVTVASMGASEPAMSWLAANAASGDNDEVSVAVSGDDLEVGGAVLSDSGTCYFIRVRMTGTTRYGSNNGGGCTGNNALLVNDDEW